VTSRVRSAAVARAAWLVFLGGEALAFSLYLPSRPCGRLGIDEFASCPRYKWLAIAVAVLALAGATVLVAIGRRIDPERHISDRRRRWATVFYTTAIGTVLLTGILSFIMEGMTRLDTTGCDLHPCIPPKVPAPGPWELTLAIGTTLTGLLASSGVVLSHSGGRSHPDRPQGA
jgi:hypothetical protein